MAMNAMSAFEPCRAAPLALPNIQLHSLQIHMNFAAASYVVLY
jgi:hypothetical protein